MSWNKRTFCPILVSIFLGLTACYNNAHLRTQKILEPGEMVYSASGILAVSGDDIYTGISGLRGEVSMLAGYETGEKGPYGGVGLGDGISYIAGYEYKKYMRLDTDLPFKLGIQGELNLTPGNEYNFKNATVLHLRPSYTTTTAKGRNYYGGIHGLLAVGSWKRQFLQPPGFPGDSNYNDELGTTRFSSIGAGVTVGSEYLFQSSSLQLQVDVSMVQNTKDEGIIRSREPAPMVSGSAGINFFKPAPQPEVPSEPYPIPYYYQEDEEYEDETESEPDVLFDPETGEPIDLDEDIEFDPETGEPIKEP
ncbi:MAG: hypothetical protein NZ709_08620 [Candidatus Marinimicrobia bacterium]|nr:hypothetical protein [Candidatus Neomarinimicrobiota bacterium]